MAAIYEYNLGHRSIKQTPNSGNEAAGEVRGQRAAARLDSWSDRVVGSAAGLVGLGPKGSRESSYDRILPRDAQRKEESRLQRRRRKNLRKTCVRICAIKNSKAKQMLPVLPLVEFMLCQKHHVKERWKATPRNRESPSNWPSRNTLRTRTHNESRSITHCPKILRQKRGWRAAIPHSQKVSNARLQIVNIKHD